MARIRGWPGLEDGQDWRMARIGEGRDRFTDRDGLPGSQCQLHLDGTLDGIQIRRVNTADALAETQH